jgi:hypothetical protein
MVKFLLLLTMQNKAVQEVGGGTEKFLLGGAEEKTATDSVA